MSCVSNRYIKSLQNKTFLQLAISLEHKMNKLGKKKSFSDFRSVPLNSAGWAWALVMSSSENYSHFDGLMMCHCLGRLFKEPQLQLCFVPPPRHPFAAFVRSSIQKKKKKREALLLVFVTSYGVFGFKGQHFYFN